MHDLRQVAGFAGYWASSNGRIYSTRTGEMIELAQRVMGKGYLYVNVKTPRDGRLVQLPMQVHRMVLLAFIGPEPFAHADGRHKSGQRTDNSSRNLEWGTRKQNIADAIKHGTHVSARKSERVGMRRLLGSDVAALRGACRDEVPTLAHRMGISTAYAHDVHRGKSRGDAGLIP